MKKANRSGADLVPSTLESRTASYRRVRGARIARLTVAFVVVSLLSLGLGIAATTLIKSPQQIAAETTPPKPTLLTAPVTSGTIKESLLATGLVAPGAIVSFAPTAPPGMDAIVTALPVAVGAQVGPGSLLMAVSDRPLILLYGTIPLTRDLTQGSVGPDVERFQDSLRGVGLEVSDRPGVFGTSTRQALSALYQSVNFTPPLDGSRRPMALRSELAIAVPGDFGRVVSIGVTVGGPVVSPAISVTTASPLITADLSELDAKKLSGGQPAALSGAGITAPITGTVLSVGELQKNDTGGMSVPVSIAPDSPLPVELKEGASVQVSIDLSHDDTPGLIAPLAGIYADSDGTTSVYVVKDGLKSQVKIKIVATGDGKAKFEAEQGSVEPGDEIYIGIR